MENLYAGTDMVLAMLHEARAATLTDPVKSRELSLVFTKIEEAILWRQRDLQMKKPPGDEEPGEGA